MELHSEIPVQQDLKMPLRFFMLFYNVSCVFDSFIHVIMFLTTSVFLELCLELQKKSNITLKAVFIWLGLTKLLTFKTSLSLKLHFILT